MRLLIVTVQYAYTLVVAASIQIWVTNICICTNMLQLVTESNRGIWIPSKINFHASNIIDRFTYHRAITQTRLKSFVRLLARINYFRSAVLSLLLAVTCATRNYDTSTEIGHFFPPLPPPSDRATGEQDKSGWGRVQRSRKTDDRSGARARSGT